MTPEQRRKRWAGSLPTSQTIVQNHWHVYAASSNNARRINVHQTDVVFKDACALGCEGICVEAARPRATGPVGRRTRTGGESPSCFGGHKRTFPVTPLGVVGCNMRSLHHET